MLSKNHGTKDSFSGIRSIKRTLKYGTFSSITLERFIEDLYLKRALLNSFGFHLCYSTYKNSNSTRNQVDEEPLYGCTTCKSLFILFIYLYYLKVKYIPNFCFFVLKQIIPVGFVHYLHN